MKARLLVASERGNWGQIRLHTPDCFAFLKNNAHKKEKRRFSKGQTPKSDIPPNIAPKIFTPENYLQIWDSSSATLIGQLAIVTLFGAILGGIPLYGPYPFKTFFPFFFIVCANKKSLHQKLTNQVN